jgi:hypothetical protein
MKVCDGEDDIRGIVGARHVEDSIGETMDECASDRGINDCEKQGASRMSEIVCSNLLRKSKPRPGLCLL